MRNFFEIKKSRLGRIRCSRDTRIRSAFTCTEYAQGGWVFREKIPREFGLTRGNEMRIPRWARCIRSRRRFPFVSMLGADISNKFYSLLELLVKSIGQLFVRD